MNALSQFSLDGKCILITGASSGIGKATVEAALASGAAVYATARNPERLAELGLEANRVIVADITEDAGREAIIAGVEHLDGLVLCAGINELAPVKFATEKKVRNIFNTNFFAQIELLRLLVKKKKFSKNASIVALSSIGGNEVYSIGQAAYGASKAALLSWMKFAAKELADSASRVNCVLPGHIKTPMNDNLGLSSEQLESYEKSIPLKRFGTPADIASPIVFLLSDASGWMTGSSLVVDGGSSL